LKQFTALHLAATAGHEAVVRMLLAAGADKEARGYDQSTPLIRATLEGHATVAQMLLAAGADMQSLKNDGNDRLAHAKNENKEGHHKMVQSLKKAAHQRAALKACLVCGVQTSLRCQLCKEAAFCRRACQKAGWKEHKKSCCGTKARNRTKP